MEVIFFIYGLAFFLLGFAILYYPKKHSTYRLARTIHFVGWFGLVHGINEWLDLLIFIQALNASAVWEIIRLITLPVSFLCLVYFGSEVISVQKKGCLFCKLFTPVLIILWGILFLAGEHTAQKWDILSRYILGFPGAALAGLALLLYIPETRGSSSFRLAVNLKVSGIAFIAYACLSGLVVHDADFFPASILNYSLFREGLGMPVQIFRSLCAVIIAYNLIKVLELFHSELQESLMNSELRFKTIVNTLPVTLFIEDKNHQIVFLEGKGLAAFNVLPSKAIGQSVSQVFAEFPELYNISRRVFSLEKEFTEVLSVEGYSYEIFLAPMKDHTGVSGAIGVVIDVSEQKKARKEIDKYRHEMEKTKELATIGSLSTEITGEVTGPLNASRIFLMKALGGLRKTIGAGEVKADIREGVAGIAQAMKTLESFCQKANLQAPSSKEPIDLFEAVERVLSVFRESAQHAMVRITTEGADLFPVLEITSRELEQILYIMIQNVIRSADGSQVYTLGVDFRLEEAFCIKFREKHLFESLQKEGMIAGVSENGEPAFEFSVLRGIVEAYGGSIAVPGTEQDVLCEIRLPTVS